MTSTSSHFKTLGGGIIEKNNKQCGNRMRTVKVIQSKEKEIPVEVIADSIKSISEGIKKIRAGRLNDKALESSKDTP